MSPQQLLKETQRAAGNENLTAWHETLISSGKELKAIAVVSHFCLGLSHCVTHFLQGLDVDRKQLANLEERHANQEREVKRFEERRAIEQKVRTVLMYNPPTTMADVRHGRLLSWRFLYPPSYIRKRE